MTRAFRSGVRCLRGLALLAGALAMPLLQAHRQDECLQAALIDVAPEQIRLFLSITPGTEVAARFNAVVDLDQNGAVSQGEAGAYVSNVVSQVTLRSDGIVRKLELKTFRFPEPEAIRAGAGTIQIEAVALVPVLTEGAHLVRFENRHLTHMSVYLANALMPETRRIVIGRQKRNEIQSEIEIPVTVQAGK